MNGGINPHRDLVSDLASDLFVNFKQVAVTFPNRFFAKSLDRVGKIELNTAAARANAAAFIANFLGRAR